MSNDAAVGLDSCPNLKNLQAKCGAWKGRFGCVRTSAALTIAVCHVDDIDKKDYADDNSIKLQTWTHARRYIPRCDIHGLSPPSCAQIQKANDERGSKYQASNFRR